MPLFKGLSGENAIFHPLLPEIVSFLTSRIIGGGAGMILLPLLLATLPRCP